VELTLENLVGALDGVGLDISFPLFCLGHLGGVGLGANPSGEVGIGREKVRGGVATAAAPTEEEDGEGPGLIS
jgi:hypothetical protein